jgi:hypothetical protein
VGGGGDVDDVTLITVALDPDVTRQNQSPRALQGALIRLRNLTSDVLAGNPDGEAALAEYKANADGWKPVLAAALQKLGASERADLVGAAQKVMSLVDYEGSKAGKYDVTVQEAEGVQVGDGNRQTSTSRNLEWDFLGVLGRRRYRPAELD